ncbi:MAG: pilus assembly FimT family protein [Bacillota bacterium]
MSTILSSAWAKPKEGKVFKANQAFTMLEVLIVVTIITTLSSAAVVQSANYQQWMQLKTSTRELVANLKDVQQRSIITALNHGVVFDLKENSYYLIKDKKNPQILKEIKLKPVILKKVNFPNYHRLAFSGPAIFFKDTGNLDHRNGRVELKLGTRKKEVVFSSNAGEINIR